MVILIWYHHSNIGGTQAILIALFFVFVFLKESKLVKGPSLLQCPPRDSEDAIMCSSKRSPDIMLYCSHDLHDSHPWWVRVLHWGSLYTTTSALLEKSLHQICEKIPLVLYPNLSVLPPPAPLFLPSSTLSLSSLPLTPFFSFSPVEYVKRKQVAQQFCRYQKGFHLHRENQTCRKLMLKVTELKDWKKLGHPWETMSTNPESHTPCGLLLS